MGQVFKPTALVVENDELQRSLVVALLEESDMKVIQCETAEAALLVLEKFGDRVSMMFTNVELAGQMDGIDLATVAKARLPDLHVIVTSGASQLRRYQDGTSFMAKPWSPIDVLIEAQKSRRSFRWIPPRTPGGRTARTRCSDRSIVRYFSKSDTSLNFWMRFPVSTSAV